MIAINNRYTELLDDLKSYAELKGYKIAIYVSRNYEPTIKIGVYSGWIKTKPVYAMHCKEHFTALYSMGSKYDNDIEDIINKMRDYIRELN